MGKKKGPAATYSPTENRSTIGVRALNFRVRDGNGCVCPAVATGPANTRKHGYDPYGRSWLSQFGLENKRKGKTDNNENISGLVKKRPGGYLLSHGKP